MTSRRVRLFALAAVTVGAAGLVGLSVRAADKEAKPAKQPAGKDVFGTTKVHAFHLEVAAKDYDTLQPKGGMRLPGFGPAPKAPEKPEEKPADVHKGGGFGIEFPWVHATFAGGGQTLQDIGLRYKGNSSYMAAARSLKRNFKVDLNRYVDDQNYQGLKAINLHAGAVDTTKMREALAYSVFRNAGVPAPRTAFAEVTLTVPGKYDKEYLGLYVVIEHIDKTFLKQHFKNAKGMLLKPERIRGLEYLGDDFAKYKDRYQPKDEPTKEQGQRLIDFTRLLNRGGDDEFRKEIASFIDVDAFLRFIAVNALVCNLDSFLMLGHNYYMYLDPETNRFVFIPWDTDLSMAAFMMGGSADQQAELSLQHPYPGENKLIDRLMAMPAVNERYQKILKELAEGCFAKEKLLAELDAIDKVIKEPLAKEKKAAEARKESAGGFGLGGFGRGMDVRTFVEKRTTAVAAQLAGKSKGYVPATGFGPGGPGAFAVGSRFAKPLLTALDADKDSKLTSEELVAGVRRFFKETDKDNAGHIDEKQLAAALQKIMPGLPGFPAPMGVQPVRPGGTAATLAAAIAKRADADKDGKLTVEELVKAAEALFAETDKDKKGKLEETALAAGINVLAPARPGFGPGPNFAKPLLDALDGDKDGKLSADELTTGAQRLFKEADKDNAGTVNEKQLAAVLTKILPPPPAFGPPPPAGGPATPLAAAIVKRAGADKDGNITQEKLVAAATALFQEIDKDKKGKLEERDIAAAIGVLLPPGPMARP